VGKGRITSQSNDVVIHCSEFISATVPSLYLQNRTDLCEQFNRSDTENVKTVSMMTRIMKLLQTWMLWRIRAGRILWPRMLSLKWFHVKLMEKIEWST